MKSTTLAILILILMNIGLWSAAHHASNLEFSANNFQKNNVQKNENQVIARQFSDQKNPANLTRWKEK